MLKPAIAVGGLMTLVGAFVVYGAVTGYLAPMLAAIFDPGVLSKASNVPSTKKNQGPLGIMGNPSSPQYTVPLQIASWLKDLGI